VPEYSRWPAPAKLNLFLRIIGRREDGYHELQTLYQLLDWGDELELAVSEDGMITRELGLAGIPAEQDLAVRAACLLQEATGSTLGARIRVHKRVPAGAGLGGGSSDAATVLLALNHLWACRLEPEDLAALGLQLGADVPLFVHGHSAWAEGVGEMLRRVSLGERHYVLVLPEVHIATGELFEAPELRRDWARLDPACGAMRAGANAFEPVVMARYPELAEIMRELRSEGVPRLTGTGSCIFIEAGDRTKAWEITERLKCRYNVRAVRGIDRSPVLEALRGGAER
jgi:4-diphosphocytidyl-2-C-methyl-D-erythritol kinase